ncbi:hypothetical protein [Sorangium sp. So ce131]|uniref:hypothetical protein n=1 Tax=Sorangium sp. So ce131 TaxID=3133282 RepID=UPI003F64332A
MRAFSFWTRSSPCSWRALVRLALCFAIAGCAASDDPPGPAPTDAACPPGTMPADGGCQAAGLPPGVTAGLPPDMPCPPGEAPLEGGGCQPAGVPPEGCGKGFEPDGRGGCDAILPEAPCPTGLMAVPGGTECHEVAPCGDGDYGTIPVEATTQFVNGAYAENDSDGTREKPWRQIQEGITHASSGAIVAVAAGTYHENVIIRSTPVRLWGRCPAMVEVVGAGDQAATIQVLRGAASRSELRGFAITGPQAGVLASGPSDVIIDRVWVHDTGGRGIGVQSAPTPASVTVRGSLVETTRDVGVFVGGSRATLDAIVVRDTQPRRDGASGSGVVLVPDPATGERASVTLGTSLLEQNHDVGVAAYGSDAKITSTVVRRTQPRRGSTGGHGIEVVDRGTLTLDASIVEQNHGVGVGVLGSDAAIHATVVRATQPRQDDDTRGQGISVQFDPEANERSSVRLHASLLEQNHEAGVSVLGSDATIDAVIVRGTQPTKSDNRGGRGISLQSHADTYEPSRATIRASVLEQNHDVGVHVVDAEATIDATIVRETSLDSAGRGWGIEVVGLSDPAGPRERTALTLRSSLVEKNHGAGVIVQSADATIEGSVVRATRPLHDGTWGNGLVVQNHGITIPTLVTASERATLTLSASLLEQNHEVGVLVVGADATIEATVVRETRPRSDGSWGRGVEIEDDPVTRARAALTLRTSLLEQNHEVGLYLYNSDARIEATVVRGTQRRSDGTAGDGIALESAEQPVAATIAWTRVESNARAGISSFSAAVTLTSSVVQCNRIDLNGEDVVEGRNFTFDGSNENLCGCDMPDPTCAVLSASLTPPAPLSPTRRAP